MYQDYRNRERRGRRGIGSRLRVFLFLCGLLTIAVLLAAKILSNETLPIRSVQIGGVFYYVEAEEVKQRIAPVIQGNFFTVNIEEIQHSVRSHPWIEKVTIHRVWPDTLRVYVVEQTPVAQVSKQELVNDKGQRFAGGLHARLPDLPAFTGPEEYYPAMTRKYLALKKALAGQQVRVRKVEVTPRRAWKILLSNGVLIKLGRKDIDQRLARLIRVYPGALSGRISSIQVIDMRYTNGFAVKWKRKWNSGDKNKNIAFGG